MKLSEAEDLAIMVTELLASIHKYEISRSAPDRNRLSILRRKVALACDAILHRHVHQPSLLDAAIDKDLRTVGQFDPREEDEFRKGIDDGVENS